MTRGSRSTHANTPSHGSDPPASAVKRRLLVGGALVVAVAAVIAVVFYEPAEDVGDEARRGDHLKIAQVHLRTGRFAQAEQAAKRELQADPNSTAALLIAGEAANQQDRYEAALAYFDRVPQDGKPEALQALFGTAEVLVHLGRLSEAEARLRRLLKRDPAHMPANLRLSYVMAITGRSWEAVPHVVQLIRRDMLVESHLLALGDFERVVTSEGHLKRCRKASPDDALPQLGLARVELDAGRASEARPLLAAAVKTRPDLVEAQARLGEALLLSERPAELAKWHLSLPAEAERHPQVWVTRGMWCREENRPQAAIRCFLEAVRLEPNHYRANYQLGQLLQAGGRSQDAAPFLKRAQRLHDLSQACTDYQNARGPRSINLDAVRRIVEATESLGRLWEAWAWTRLAQRNQPGLDWVQQAARRLQPRLKPDLPHTLLESNPSATMNLADFPLPDWTKIAGGTPGSGPVAPGDIRFRDRAEELGIRFMYFNAADDAPGSYIYETTGGGVAAIDFDNDGWPDLYFTQGAPWPATEKPHGYRDRFYRNVGGARFIDVTDAAGLGDERFGQGVTVGDFDSDGFPDLYVANMGVNRLYRNNGDGTFTDVGPAAGIARADWTTSCILADLNADGLPDLYDVNYIADENLRRLCYRNGKPKACSPVAFKAAQDRVWINRGDGTFNDVTAAAGIVKPGGYGLGIVAADFAGTGRLDLFVGNDKTPNFLFVNRSQPGGEIVFDEQALASGVASDAEGKSQACMGIAVGDADGDGRIDLFVTNFIRESNTLYFGRDGRFFSDETRRTNLSRPGMQMLGFGTQFLDADLDGRPDLVVANGHVDDHSDFGEPYRMPPQFFRNLGSGRFAEVPAKSLGDYFRRKWLGRGLARLDFNRDGKDDFAVSNTASPASLVANETPSTNRFLTVRLIGTTSCRDAIGATVSIRLGDRTIAQQLTAGDGYMASNQRQLVFGLGKTSKVDQLLVRWPNARIQTFPDLSADAEVLILEGARLPVTIPGK